MPFVFELCKKTKSSLERLTCKILCTLLAFAPLSHGAKVWIMSRHTRLACGCDPDSEEVTWLSKQNTKNNMKRQPLKSSTSSLMVQPGVLIGPQALYLWVRLLHPMCHLVSALKHLSLSLHVFQCTEFSYAQIWWNNKKKKNLDDSGLKQSASGLPVTHTFIIKPQTCVRILTCCHMLIKTPPARSAYCLHSNVTLTTAS